MLKAEGGDAADGRRAHADAPGAELLFRIGWIGQIGRANFLISAARAPLHPTSAVRETWLPLSRTPNRPRIGTGSRAEALAYSEMVMLVASSGSSSTSMRML